MWKRFRSAADGFVFSKEDDYYSAHVVAHAERIVDLLLALIEQLPPAIDVAIVDARRKRKWRGDRLPLPDVRDALTRIKTLVAAAGGVEIAIYSGEDQLTLNPMLELFIYARTDRWLYLLQGKGLEERRLVRTNSWKLSRHEFPAAPELEFALDTFVESLGLTAE
ncbi:MAG: hypothetical protein ABI884_07455 [Gemmatimonadota bacterium]|nr:hypothetical protein [Gemmatimonadaceae bacterium]